MRRFSPHLQPELAWAWGGRAKLANFTGLVSPSLAQLFAHRNDHRKAAEILYSPFSPLKRNKDKESINPIKLVGIREIGSFTYKMTLIGQSTTMGGRVYGRWWGAQVAG